jgi:hypothetical protein
MKMWTCLGMNRDSIRPRPGEERKIGIARRNHEMHVKWDGCVRPQGSNHSGTNRNIRHKVAIHNVNVNPIRASNGDRPSLRRIWQNRRKVSKVRRREVSYSPALPAPEPMLRIGPRARRSSGD